MIVAAYLAAIVTANLLVAAFGPGISIVNAFVLVGFDLVARDRLHDRWRHDRLALRMAALIAAGGVVSVALNPAAGRIAVASTVAFVLASCADAVTYHGLRDRDWLQRANGSNVAGAAVDSLVFPTIAFGALLPWVVAGQFAAKVGGGLVWSVVLERRRARHAAARQ